MSLLDRHSPRAYWHNYNLAGLYFVTICCRKHERFFGKIKNNEMHLSEVGKVCKEEIIKLNQRKTVKIHEYVVMPNHVHILLELDDRKYDSLKIGYEGPSLGTIINVFKGQVKKYSDQKNIRFNRQSRYHDHIIRNEGEYKRIKFYISSNVENWSDDQLCDDG